MKNPNLDLSKTFETYETSDTSNPKSLLLNLINNPKDWTYDLVVIQSRVGNGATHLLNAVGVELERQGKCAAFIFGDKLRFTKTEDRVFPYEDVPNDIEFLLLDYSSYFSLSTHQRYKELVNLLESLIERNVKIVMTRQIGLQDYVSIEFPNHLIIDSGFPKNNPSIANIIRKHFDSLDGDSCFQSDEQKEQAIQALAIQPYSSVRALENTVITFLASVKAKKVNLRNGDTDALIKNFVENIDSPTPAAI